MLIEKSFLNCNKHCCAEFYLDRYSDILVSFFKIIKFGKISLSSCEFGDPNTSPCKILQIYSYDGGNATSKEQIEIFPSSFESNLSKICLNRANERSAMRSFFRGRTTLHDHAVKVPFAIPLLLLGVLREARKRSVSRRKKKEETVPVT